MENKNLTLKWPHVGNGHIIEYLERLLLNKYNGKTEQLAGTFIFNGPEDLGKTTVATSFAKFLLCQADFSQSDCDCESCRFFLQAESKQDLIHGDFHIVKKNDDKKNISVEKIRELINILNMSSFLNSFKIGIIKNADSLSEKAANALLKTLEEPKKNVVIILITNDLDAIPATIKSRAKVLNFLPVPVDIIYDHLLKDGKAKRDEAKIISRMSFGRPALAMKLFQNKEYYQKNLQQVEMFFNFLDQDLNERLMAINNLWTTKKNNQDEVREARKILELWEGLIRDGFLFKYSNNFLMQNSQFAVMFKKFSNLRNLSEMIKLLNNIKIAKNYLIANVNFKTVIENVAVQV
jgi:DNA polymerase-3 subunit delta'